MIFHLFRRTPQSDSIASLYGMIVAQARAPAFYQDYGVPDTVDGRFEMVVLHTVLVLRRLDAEPGPVRRLGQAVFDLFCRDMDASLREMGVGDLKVPREMRRIGEAFYGRKAAYEAALAIPTASPSWRRWRATYSPRPLAQFPARRGWRLICGRRYATWLRRMARRSPGEK